MNSMDWKGRTALVTGASSGLGVHFARELAERGMDLVLVARRLPELEAEAARLREACGVKVEVVPMDLQPLDAAQRLHQEVLRRGLTVDVLVNNAGFGLYGAFLDIPLERQQDMLLLDILTLTALTRRFAEDMTARGHGRILNIASIGGWQPSPLYAAYGAAKAYVLNFSEALAFELRGTGVTCTVLSPGITATAFLRVSGQAPTPYQRLTMMRPEAVARIGIRALLKGRTSVVPGILNALTVASNRIMPRRLSACVAHAVMR